MTNTEKQCQIPPRGWRCTRKPGHEGPCAAIKDGEWDKIGRKIGAFYCPICGGYVGSMDHTWHACPKKKRKGK